MDYTQLTDTELQEIFHAASEETSRRNLISAALTREPILQTGYMVALGRTPDTPWAQPLGAFDAYPEGWEVAHNGKTWVSLTPANVWEPGVSGWREVTGGYPAWAQPTGAHDAYNLGDRVTHAGQDWESTTAANTWAPGEHGWTVIN